MKQTRLTVTGVLDNFCYKQTSKSKALGKSRQVQTKPEKPWGLGCPRDKKPNVCYKQGLCRIYWSTRLWAFKHLWHRFIIVSVCGTQTHTSCQQGQCQWCTWPVAGNTGPLPPWKAAGLSPTSLGLSSLSSAPCLGLTHKKEGMWLAVTDSRSF